MMIQTPTSSSTSKLHRAISGAAVPGPGVRSHSARGGTVISRHSNGGSTEGTKGTGRKASMNGNSNGSRTSKPKKQKLWSPWKLILFSIMIGIAGSLYLTHVFQTQNTLQEVQELRRDYERAHRIHTDVRRNYDRMTGPAEVYRRAESMGMVSGGAMDPVILVPK